MHIVITGGGTGGHIFPALEIAKEFVSQNQKVKITFVGNTGALEERMAQNCGFAFFGLKTKQVVGQGIFKKLQALFYLKIAILKSLYFLLKHRARAVVGVGGYVSAPMVIAAFILRIPRYICEQNVVPGFANKALALLANKIFMSFSQSSSYFFNQHTVFTGNPIRKQFFSLEPKAPVGPFCILVSGGSMGAAFLNQEVPKALALSKQSCPNLSITHQTGQAKLAEVDKHYHDAGLDAKVVPFIDNMPEAFKQHHLLISRAGATVIAEIMASGMPSLLVPYRFAQGHQRENALALARIGAAIMLEEAESFAKELSLAVQQLYHHHENLVLIGQKAKTMATPRAAANIVKNILQEM